MKVKPTFINGPRSLSGNPFYCVILDIWEFNSFILAEAGTARIAEFFAKALETFGTYLFVNNNLW